MSSTRVLESSSFNLFLSIFFFVAGVAKHYYGLELLIKKGFSVCIKEQFFKLNMLALVEIWNKFVMCIYDQGCIHECFQARGGWNIKHNVLPWNPSFIFYRGLSIYSPPPSHTNGLDLFLKGIDRLCKVVELSMQCFEQILQYLFESETYKTF